MASANSGADGLILKDSNANPISLLERLYRLRLVSAGVPWRAIRPLDLDGHPCRKEVPPFADLRMGATIAVKGLFGCELVDEPAKRRAGATIMVGVGGEAAHRSKVSYSARSQEVWEGRGGSYVWQSQRQLARKGQTFTTGATVARFDPCKFGGVGIRRKSPASVPA